MIFKDTSKWGDIRVEREAISLDSDSKLYEDCIVIRQGGMEVVVPTKKWSKFMREIRNANGGNSSHLESIRIKLQGIEFNEEEVIPIIREILSRVR